MMGYIYFFSFSLVRLAGPGTLEKMMLALGF
jgi:hypothetical protein